MKAPSIICAAGLLLSWACPALAIPSTDAPLGARAAANAAAAVQLPFGTAPILLNALPTLLPQPIIEDAASIEAIRNTLALYPLSIDGKNFAALSAVFASNAVANYSAPLGVLTGLPTIQATLSASLTYVTTQHKLTTQYITIQSPTSAFSVTYFQADHFGMGNLTGQVATAYAQYQDTWARQKDLSWRIAYRNFVYMAPVLGNLAVFAPQ